MATYGSGTYGSGLYGIGSVTGPSFATEVEKFKLRPVVLLEIDFGDGTQYYSYDAVRFLDRFYEGRILNLGEYRRAIQQNLGFFEISSIDANLADTDREIITEAETQTIKGILARFKVGTQDMVRDDFETVFEGLIDDFGAQNYTFNLLVRDKLWTLPEKPITGTVNSTDFPNALPADVGKPLPICYGEHSDTDTNNALNRGAWPTIYVDVQMSEQTFLIARHAVKSIDEVYAYKPSAGSQLLTLTTDYTAHKAGTLNGETMAYIKLTAAGLAKLTDTNALGILTVNVKGKETVGDGTGDLIENPIDVLEDLFANYLEDPETNSSAFSTAKTTATDRNYVVAGGYIEEMPTDELIRDICNSFQIRIYPDKNGKIAVSIFKPISPFEDGPELREQWEILRGTWSIDYSADVQGAEDAQVINTIEYRYSYHWAKKHFRGNGTESDSASITSYGEKELLLNCPWAKDNTTAEDVARRLKRLYKNPVPHAEFMVPMQGANVELTDVINITHRDSPGSGGYSQRAFEIIEHALNMSDMSVRLRAKDVGSVVEGLFYLDDEDLRIIANTGTAGVVSGDGTITITGGPSDLAAEGVKVGDIVSVLRDSISFRATNNNNLKNLKITAVSGNTVETSYTGWTTESGLLYKILPSWLTKTGNQNFAGHICDESAEEFSNGDKGLILQ